MPHPLDIKSRHDNRRLRKDRRGAAEGIVGNRRTTSDRTGAEDPPN
jgi:hypothetical protein